LFTLHQPLLMMSSILAHLMQPSLLLKPGRALCCGASLPAMPLTLLPLSLMELSMLARLTTRCMLVMPTPGINSGGTRPEAVFNPHRPLPLGSFTFAHVTILYMLLIPVQEL